MKIIPVLLLFVFLFGCKQEAHYDVIIRNGMIYDGNGGEPFKGDIGIDADTIAFIGELHNVCAPGDRRQWNGCVPRVHQYVELGK